MSRSRARRSAPLAVRQATKAVATPQEASKAVDVSALGILDFVSGTTASVDKLLNAAEQYWIWANRHPWVGSAVRIISDAISSEGYEIVDPSNQRDQDSIDADVRIKSIRTILDHPNNDQRLADLMSDITMDIDVTGKGYVHILRFGNTMTGLERIDARTMAPKLSTDGKKIDAFLQRTRTNGLLTYTSFDPADIIFFKLPGGPDILGGTSLIELLDLTLAVDYGARKHNAAYFRNGAKAGTVYVNKKMDQKQAEQNMRTFEASRVGTENAYRTLVLAGEWDIHPTETANDEEFGKGQDRALMDVCAVFRVPESKLKTTEGALGGNGKEQDDQTFHEECVTPRAKRIYRTISRRVLEDQFGYDPQELEIRPKSRYSIRVSQIANAIALLQAGGSVNEARALIGLPKSAVDADLDRPYIINTVVQIQTDAEKQQALDAQTQAAQTQHDNSLAAGAQAHAQGMQSADQKNSHAIQQIITKAAVAPKPPPIGKKATEDESEAEKASPKPEARGSGRFRVSRPSTPA